MGRRLLLLLLAALLAAGGCAGVSVRGEQSVGVGARSH